jgi:hypothetical protein
MSPASGPSPVARRAVDKHQRRCSPGRAPRTGVGCRRNGCPDHRGAGPLWRRGLLGVRPCGVRPDGLLEPVDRVPEARVDATQDHGPGRGVEPWADHRAAWTAPRSAAAPRKATARNTAGRHPVTNPNPAKATIPSSARSRARRRCSNCWTTRSVHGTLMVTSRARYRATRNGSTPRVPGGYIHATHPEVARTHIRIASLDELPAPDASAGLIDGRLGNTATCSVAGPV